MAAVLVPEREREREPVQFVAVHFLLMLSRNFGQNELDRSVNFCCSGDDVSKWKLRLEDHFYIRPKTTRTLCVQIDFPPSLLVGLAFSPANERTKVQSDSPSSPILLSSTSKIFRHTGSHCVA